MDHLAAPERGIWVSATGKVRVECPHRVLEEIRAATVQGLCRFPRGGLEVGGVLLGSVRDGVVRVIAARPVECSYARGPSFTLTEGDEAAFRKMIGGGGADLRAVGWYHSHTRSDLSFSKDDAAVHERLFPEQWQFALVVRPEPFGSAEAAFFSRGESGVMEPVPHGALLLRPAARLKASGYGTLRTARTEGDTDDLVPPAVQVVGLETSPEPEPAASASTSAPDPPAPSARPEEMRPPEYPFAAAPVAPDNTLRPQRGDLRKRPHRVVWACVAAAGLLAVVVVSSTLHSRSAPAVPPHLSLQVAESNGQLQITWDRNSAPLKHARGGSVHIQDGGQDITVPFNAERLRAGALTYARTSQDVEVRLRVEGPEPAEESVRLFGPAVEPGPAIPAPAAAPAPKDVEPPQPREEPLQRPAEGLELATAKTEPLDAAARVRTDEPEREPTPPRPFRPAVLPQRAQVRVPLPQPPSVQGAPPLSRGDIGVGVPSAGPPPEPRAEPSEKPAPAAPVSAPVVPASGRLIWVGRLERGGRLSIDGQRASSGVVTGELPGVPVRISAYPAELGDAGLRVFASSPGLRGSREAAGPQNGWNPTVYAWDARRSTDVLVTEVPSAENGWRGISVRGNGQPVSVIVIEWRAAHP